MVFQPGIAQPTIDQPTGQAQTTVPFISVVCGVPLFTRRVQYQVQSEPVAPVTVVTPVSIGWFAPLSEPQRSPARDAWFLFQPHEETAQFPETVTESRWHQPWSEPQRNRWFPTPEQPEPAADPKDFVPTTVWFMPLSEPVRTPPRAADFPSPYEETAQFPETVTESRWHQPWSEPVIKTLARAADYPQPAYGTYVTPAAAFSVFWFTPWSEPVRTPLRAADFPYLAWDPNVTFPETVTESRWHQPWSEPVRTRFVPTAENPDTVLGQPPANVSWFAPLAEPERFAPRAADFPFTAFPGDPRTYTNYFDGWFEPWSEPQRSAARDAWYQPFTHPDIATFEIVFYDKWGYPWSEPVRTRYIPTADQPEPAYDPKDFTPSFAWYEPYSEPVRTKPALPAPEHLFHVWPIQPVIDLATKFGWPREPWYEPVRFLPRAADFPAYFRNDVWPIPITVAATGTWASIEPLDAGSFYGTQFATPATVSVGIHQNRPNTAS